MRFAAYIADRYLRSRRRSRMINRVSIIAITGIALGVLVLDLTMTIMNGLRAELSSTFVDNMPMITVYTSDPDGFEDLGFTMDEIAATDGVTGVAPFIRQETVASVKIGWSTEHLAAVCWGIDPDRQGAVTPLEDMLVHPESSLAALRGEGGAPGVVIGAQLAETYYVGMEDTLVLTAPKGDLGNLDRIESVSRRFVVRGFLETGLYDFDSRFLYMNLDHARDFFDYAPDGAQAVGVRLDDMMAAQTTAATMQENLGRSYHCSDWMSLNHQIFKWVKIEKIMMGLLLGLVILVAAFNIIAILTMMVGERRREIGILLAMGARRSQIQAIFMLDGLVVGAIGTALGSLLAWLGYWFLDTKGLPIPNDIYVVDHVPVIASAADFATVAAAAVAITLLASWVPSFEASRLRPMDIIRYT